MNSDEFHLILYINILHFGKTKINWKKCVCVCGRGGGGGGGGGVQNVVWFGLVWLMVINANFNNISAISRRSVLVMEEARVPGEYYRPTANH